MKSKFFHCIAASLLGGAAAGCAHDPDEVLYTAVERGRYLAERVGMCHDCHTPRDERGEFRRERWLEGAALPFQPTVAMPWAPAAPAIAGLPNLTDGQAVAFFTSGELPEGRRLRPPMPEFRFRKSDAHDLVANLRSLAKENVVAR